MITYLFKAPQDNLYKIGKTKNLKNRTNVLKNSNPDLEYICAVKGDFEKELKLLLKPYHYKREFYRLDDKQYQDLVEYFYFKYIENELHYS